MLFENKISLNKKRSLILIAILLIFVGVISMIASCILSLPIALLIISFLRLTFQSVNLSYQTNRIILLITILFIFLFIFSINFLRTYTLYKTPIYKKMIQANAFALSPKQKSLLYPILEGLSLSAGLPLPNLYIIHTDKVNAFALSNNDGESGIAITQGLISNFNKEEIEGILAHELAHILNNDSYINQLLLVISSLYDFMGITLFEISKLFWSNSEKSVPNILFASISLLTSILGTLFSFIARPFSLLVRLATSRQREYLADATSVSLTRSPNGLIKALKKIQSGRYQTTLFRQSSLSGIFSFEINKKRWHSFFSTHPTIENRIHHLEELQ